jgi:hypothetical protein
LEAVSFIDRVTCITMGRRGWITISGVRHHSAFAGDLVYAGTDSGKPIPAPFDRTGRIVRAGRSRDTSGQRKSRDHAAFIFVIASEAKQSRSTKEGWTVSSQ